MGKIIRRVLTIIPVAALQVLWYLLLMKWLAPYAPVIASLLSAAAFFLVLFIVIKRDESAYKLLWLLVILTILLLEVENNRLGHRPHLRIHHKATLPFSGTIDGRQLEKVATHYHLYATKWNVRLLAYNPAHFVYHI